MRIAIVLTPLNDHHLRLAAQIGASDVVYRYPGLNLDELLRVQERIESFGLRLSVIEGAIPHDRITHGRPGREEQIAGFQRLIGNMAQAGVPILCYNFMPDDDWSRTSWTTPARGGALVSSFDAKLLDPSKVGRGGPIDETTMWANLAHFLREVVPAAEDAGVKLALHPDDPPLSPLCGQARIMRDVAAFDRLLNLDNRPANGLCFCQGCFAQIGVDIPATIEHFRGHIHYAHFRDVVGCMPCFTESFHDNGKTDMFAAMRAYQRIGFDGPMRPDHVPVLDGESLDQPGYTMLGRLHAVGFMQGLLAALRSSRE